MFIHEHYFPIATIKFVVHNSMISTSVLLCLCRFALQWRHNGRDSVSNHQPHDCLLNCLFRRRSKKTWKLRITGLCGGNSPGTGEFPAQMASNAENVSISWRHHGISSVIVLFDTIFNRVCSFTNFVIWLNIKLSIQRTLPYFRTS